MLNVKFVISLLCLQAKLKMFNKNNEINCETAILHCFAVVKNELAYVKL